MSPEQWERLRELEGFPPNAAAELVRQRMRRNGVEGPDPMDEGTRLLIEELMEVRK
jgi:hypothetical protein